MKNITIAILLFATLGAYAQVTSEDIKKDITPLIKKIEILESKSEINAKEISSLTTKLSFANKQIDSLISKTDENQNTITQGIRLLINKIEVLENKDGINAKEIRILTTKLSFANKQIDSLISKTEENQNTIKQAITELGNEIKQTGATSDGKINNVSKVLSKNSLYGIIGVLLAIVLSGVLFFLWNRRQQNDKSEIIRKLDNTKIEIDKEIQNTKGDLTLIEKKLFEEYNKQVNAIEQLFLSVSELNIGKTPPTDHSLTLKVADEITRINAFANTLEPTKQEAIALKGSVRRIIDNFKVNNYEIVDLLGQKYDDRLKVIVVGEAIDPNLKSGDEIITRIIKPLVKFNGEQIQAAQVEISIGQ